MELQRIETGCSLPIHVLCVFSSLGRGGAETMCMNLYRKLDQSVIQFGFVKHSKKEFSYEEEIRQLGGKIYTAPEYKIYNHYAYCKWWKSFFIDHPEYIIVHGHYMTQAGKYLRIAREYGRITIAHSHSVQPRGNKLARIYKRIAMKSAEKNADELLACSDEAGKAIFKNSFNIIRNAIDIRKYCYDEKIRRSVRRSLGIEKKFVVGVVGSMMEIKNPIGVIKIYKEILKIRDNSVMLWVGDGPLRAKIENEIEKNNLSDSIRLLGNRSDVPQLMQAMDVFILPSFSEGLGIVAIEAQATGLLTMCSKGVSHEAGITDLCRFLPLDNFELWAMTALDADNIDRKDTSKEIKDAGYDINTTVLWLQEYYKKLFDRKISENQSCCN